MWEIIPIPPLPPSKIMWVKGVESIYSPFSVWLWEDPTLITMSIIALCNLMHSAITCVTMGVITVITIILREASHVCYYGHCYSMHYDGQIRQASHKCMDNAIVCTVILREASHMSYNWLSYSVQSGGQRSFPHMLLWILLQCAPWQSEKLPTYVTMDIVTVCPLAVKEASHICHCGRH